MGMLALMQNAMAPQSKATAPQFKATTRLWVAHGKGRPKRDLDGVQMEWPQAHAEGKVRVLVQLKCRR
jgi:hypothetical protein